ncbi:MAG TPA: hypothetical protein VIL11_07195 [Limnochordales bacterium]
MRHRPQHSQQEGGECTLQVRFDLPASSHGDGRLAAWRFVQLLQLHSWVQVLVGVGSAGMTVAVRFVYHSELERSRLFDHIVWLLELSDRATA